MGRISLENCLYLVFILEASSPDVSMSTVPPVISALLVFILLLVKSKYELPLIDFNIPVAIVSATSPSPVATVRQFHEPLGFLLLAIRSVPAPM